MDQKRLQEIVDALAKKGVDLPCPRCGFTDFDALAETYLHMAGTGYFFGDDKLPAALIACRKCGFLSLHALSRLLAPETPAPLAASSEPVAAENAG